MTLGAGFATAGTSPAGVGVTALTQQLAAYEQSTTGAVSSIQIDPETRDYVYDSYGSESPMSDTGQRVLLCIQTTLGSRIGDLTFGFEPPTKIPSDLSVHVEEALRTALAPVLSDDSATLVGVRTESNGTRANAVVTWRDNRTNRETTVRTQINLTA